MGRLCEEARDQGGLLTQEDLAQILSCDARTVRRDIKALKDLGIHPHAWTAKRHRPDTHPQRCSHPPLARGQGAEGSRPRHQPLPCAPSSATSTTSPASSTASSTASAYCKPPSRWASATFPSTPTSTSTKSSKAKKDSSCESQNSRPSARRTTKVVIPKRGRFWHPQSVSTHRR
ncbi:MAG: DUF1670 domain-containing protein [Verrucomicrobiaceae bacterium]|nr:DUF1670 domain-containing protein [Verrucomicrobiaceae bacterium]